MSDWISVKDRMPESGSTVLVLRNDRYLYNGSEFRNLIIQTAICCNDDYKSKIFVSDNKYYLPHVTHWMPLPQPPESEE